ncbi:putative carboxypeptidase [Podospora conica]|nr:putative carboxypeptidase [Schizothecium conicum]
MATFPEICVKLLNHVKGTVHDCWDSLTPVIGGSTNVVCRGNLRQPGFSRFDVGTVILKYTTDSLAVNADFKLEASRCETEVAMMRMLSAQPDLPFRSPRVLSFFRAPGGHGIQVHDDFGAVLSVSDVLRSPTTDPAVAVAIGVEAGRCLKSFHQFTATFGLPLGGSPKPSTFVNQPMRNTKYNTSYKNLVDVLGSFPGVLEGDDSVLMECVQLLAHDELEEMQRFDAGAEALKGWGMIHGDFCAGNVLLLESPSSVSNKLAIIDWEMAQYGHRAYDLGQFIGDLLEIAYLDTPNSISSLCAIQGFIRGYGGLSDELAFRTAIHAGVHFVYWHVRRPPSDMMLGTPDRIQTSMKCYGRDFIVHGWLKNRAWFKGTALGSLFGFL